MIEIKNAITYQEMLVGGQPSAEQFREAADQGFRLVINLRTEAEAGALEAPSLVEGLGMRYVAIPTRGESGMTRANAEALDAALKEASGPVMIHCASGNRVGGLLALRAHFVLGLEPHAALEEGKKAGLTGLQKSVARVLGL